MHSDCKRGAVLEVNLDPSVGREYRKLRPCVVVQSDLLNRYSQVTIIAPITGAENVKKLGPNLVPIRKGEAGLEKDSVVVCHQLRRVDGSRLGKIYGHVTPDTMKKISEALRIVLELS
jgi:mRNA interferase MazF